MLADGKRLPHALMDLVGNAGNRVAVTHVVEHNDELVAALTTDGIGLPDTTLEPLDNRLERIERIVEKPAPEKAPSTLAVVGRYILTPRIFYHLENVRPGSGGEIQLTDAIAALLAEERVLAYRYRGTRFDCGSKIGYLQATIEFARRHPEVGAAFNTYLKTLELA